MIYTGTLFHLELILHSPSWCWSVANVYTSTAGQMVPHKYTVKQSHLTYVSKYLSAVFFFFCLQMIRFGAENHRTGREVRKHLFWSFHRICWQFVKCNTGLILKRADVRWCKKIKKNKKKTRRLTRKGSVWLTFLFHGGRNTRQRS